VSLECETGTRKKWWKSIEVWKAGNGDALILIRGTAAAPRSSCGAIGRLGDSATGRLGDCGITSLTPGPYKVLLRIGKSIAY
jgi:hypothetical protein